MKSTPIVKVVQHKIKLTDKVKLTKSVEKALQSKPMVQLKAALTSTQPKSAEKALGSKSTEKTNSPSLQRKQLLQNPLRLNQPQKL